MKQRDYRYNNYNNMKNTMITKELLVYEIYDLK